MFVTGFADEAATGIDGQIRATKELGWSNIESRAIDNINIHDLSDSDFDIVYGKLQDAGVRINCFGSTIGNWAKKIDEPFDSSLAEAKRSIFRMNRLGCKRIRIMSFAVLEDHEPDDQMELERFKRLWELQSMFTDAGMQCVHENCMNYGGMGWAYTLRIIENVPGLKLVFDTGNPICSLDRTKPKPYPMQSAWEFYSHVKDHVAYVHIKDGRWDPETKKATFTYPGESDGDVVRIVNDLIANGYDDGFSIEPHMAVVYHDASVKSEDQIKYDTYVEYGRRFEKILKDACAANGRVF
ncbi:MAG: TIM barrel protein [Armatimonadota bacterium]